MKQKQVDSLTRKNASLTRKLDAPSTAAKPRKKAKAKPITLSLPDLPKKPKSTTKTKSKKKSSDSSNEQWVDKWWDTF
jgi:hypothetical protein